MWDFRKIGRWAKGKFGRDRGEHHRARKQFTSDFFDGERVYDDAYQAVLSDGMSGYPKPTLSKPKQKKTKHRPFRRIKQSHVFFGKYVRRYVKPEPLTQRGRSKRFYTSILNRCVLAPKLTPEAIEAGMHYRTLYLHPTKGWRTRRMV